jgi:hypothetical protein
VVKKMGLKKSGLKQENPRPQDPGLFGVIDKAIPATLKKKTIKDPQITLSNKSRRLTQISIREAEYHKARAITLIHQTPIR